MIKEMPEGPEVCRTAEIVNNRLTGYKLISLEFFDQQVRLNQDDLEKALPLRLSDCNSCGKLLWLQLPKGLSVWFNFGLFGYLVCEPSDVSETEATSSGHKRASFTFKKRSNSSKSINLVYYDSGNFGLIRFCTSKVDLKNKIRSLKPDYLKDPVDTWNIDSFQTINKNITNILMSQKHGSGLGAYLVCEILYDAAIGPDRLGTSLTDLELAKLEHSIARKIKLAYARNSTGYWKKHRATMIDDPTELTDYHPRIKLRSSEVFKFWVYKRKQDPFGNKTATGKFFGNRVTWYVPAIQK